MTLNKGASEKYFICAIGKAISVGISAAQARSIIPADGAGEAVSLASLLKLGGAGEVHGIVLKGQPGGDRSRVLLTPRIDTEIDIRRENIHPLPAAVCRMLKYFCGALFLEEKLLLILDTQKLSEAGL